MEVEAAPFFLLLPGTSAEKLVAVCARMTSTTTLQDVLVIFLFAKDVVVNSSLVYLCYPSFSTEL